MKNIENKHTIPAGCPNCGDCHQRKKTLEKLKDDFPYFGEHLTLEQLQICVCDICKEEWDIPRFGIKRSNWKPPKK